MSPPPHSVLRVDKRQARWSAIATASVILAFTAASNGQSIARIWMDENLNAIRIDRPHPPVQARNLFTTSVAAYNAWAAYDTVAIGYGHHERISTAGETAQTIANWRREAISYAVYRVLKKRYSLSINAATTLAALDARMNTLGYSTSFTSTSGSTPAAVGNRVAANVLSFFFTDGSLEPSTPPNPVTNAYNQPGYGPPNPPLTVSTGAPTGVVNPNKWQPLALSQNISQNGFVEPSNIQTYLGSQWLTVRPFALTRTNNSLPWINPGAPSAISTSLTNLSATHQSYMDQMAEVIRYSSYLTPADGVTVDISPGAMGNNPLGTNSGTGHTQNPATGQSYAPNVVKRGDFGRVLAEFWADGPNSETPPGHWNVLAAQVSDHASQQNQIEKAGPVLDDLEWDVKLYFALNAANHDAACAAWALKRQYEGTRPITGIRFMGLRGQVTDQQASNWHLQGLPLIPGLIETITSASSQPGQRHAALAAHVGKIAVYAWPGEPASPATQSSGVKWILATDWVPYQKKTFVSPAFPGYISGHSTFSRASAEVMAAFTGSNFFPGGMSTHTAAQNGSLTFEQGPSQTITLQWATYFDAADQAGLSRLWGGIHIAEDDVKGRIVGSQAGKQAYARAKAYWTGTILNNRVPLNVAANGTNLNLEWTAERGMFYKVQFSGDLSFWLEFSSPVQAGDSVMSFTDPFPIGFDGTQRRYYRVVRSLAP